MRRRTETIIVATVVVALVALSGAGYATGYTAGGIIAILPLIALVLTGYLGVLVAHPDGKTLRAVRRFVFGLVGVLIVVLFAYAYLIYAMWRSGAPL
jgi:hypothetical protein